MSLRQTINKQQEEFPNLGPIELLIKKQEKEMERGLKRSFKGGLKRGMKRKL